MSANRSDTRPLNLDGRLDPLRSTRFGRVSIVNVGRPIVVPVTFRPGEEHVVVHVADDQYAISLSRNRVVVFVADSSSAAG